MGKVRVSCGWGVWSTTATYCAAALGSLLLLACGETARDAQLMTSVAGSSAAAGARGVAGGAVAGSSGSAGAAVVEVPVQISGRWAMFNFEDPVGVLLTQTDAGVLGGRGCAAGTPGVAALDDETHFCGNLTGLVSGASATFHFPFDDGTPGGYATKVTVSRDAQRMTGTFGNGAVEGTFRIAWLRVPDGALWLERAPREHAEPWEGGYELKLVADDSDGGEYVFGRTYELSYWWHTIRGDLGAYWSSEVSEPNGDRIQVGPVPATAPELPTSLQLELDAQGFTAVQATTASGHVYEFGATRRL